MTRALAILFFGLLISCEDASEPHVNSDLLIEGLLTSNRELVNTEINKLTADLKPRKDVHRSNLNTLVTRISDQTDGRISCSVFCYACIETLPPQSELSLELDSVGVPVYRIIDILTPDGGLLKCVGLHE